MCKCAVMQQCTGSQAQHVSGRQTLVILITVSCACLRYAASTSTYSQPQQLCPASNSSALRLSCAPVENAAAAADDLDAVPAPAAPPGGRRRGRLRCAAVSGSILNGHVATVDNRAACRRKDARCRSIEAHKCRM